MNIKPLIATLGVCALLAACSSGPKTLPVMDISGNVGVANTADTAAVMSLSLALVPEATDSTLLKYPSLAGVVDGNYYIFSKSLMVFEPSGKCLVSANRVGPGPEEYQEWSAAKANSLTGGWVVTAYPYGVKTYTRNGQYLTTDTLPGMDNLCQLGDGWVATNNSLTNDHVTFYYYDNNFHLTDTLATHINHRVYKSDSGSTGLNCQFYSNGKDAFIVRHDTIFNASDPHRGLEPVAIARFSDRMVPEDLDLNAHRNWYEEYIEPTYLFGDDYVMVMYSHETPNQTIQFYNLATGELVLSLTAKVTRETPGFAMSYNGSTIYLFSAYKAIGNRFYFTASEDQIADLTGIEDPNPAFFYLEIK